MAVRFASVTSEEITQINEEAVPENTEKATKFGLKVMVWVFNPEFIDKNNGKGFVYKCKLILRNLTNVHLKIKVEWYILQNSFGGAYLTIRPVARKGYGSIAHEAKPNGLLIRGPWGRRV